MQVVGAPLSERVFSFLTWQSTSLVFAGMILAVLFLLPMMRGPIVRGGMLNNIGIKTTCALGAVANFFIGLANIAHTFLASWAGKRYSKKDLLAAIYPGLVTA